MNIQMIGLVLKIILETVDGLTDNRTAQKIIDLLQQWLPTILNEAQDLLATVNSIIDTLKGKEILTPEQITTIDAINRQSDTDFDTAAAAAAGGA